MKKILILLICIIGCAPDTNNINYIEKEFVKKYEKVSKLKSTYVGRYEGKNIYGSVNEDGLAVKGVDDKGGIREYFFSRTEMENILRFCTNERSIKMGKKLAKLYNEQIGITNED